MVWEVIADGFHILSWVGLTSRRTAEQEGHLTVSHSLLGQIIVHNERMLAVVSEPFTHGASSEWGNVLKRGGFGSGGGNDDGVLHRIILFERLDELSNGRTLLSHSNVDTVELLGLVVAVVPPLLIEHGVEGDSSLSGLTITNDQLTLTTANRHHGVDRLETCLYWLIDGTTRQDAGSLELRTSLFRGLDGTFAIDGVTQSIDNTAEKCLADGDVNLDVSARSSQVLKFSISNEDEQFLQYA